MNQHDSRLAETATMTAGGALLARLKAVGVDYIFANSGTDFPPVIEGLAEAQAKDIALPVALTMPHENAAMGMAHGYYLATGRAQAVMAHTNVGLANCAIGAINAACENIPVLLFSGRTPTAEQNRFGARTVPIGWGQEMRDQTALVREATKWDYELRFPEQALEIADRAYAIANSTPRGPVYVSLPREVLCQPCPSDGLGKSPLMVPARAAAHPADIERTARILAEAHHPVIFAQHGAGGARGFRLLSALAEEWGIPVCQYWAVQLALPTDHPMAAPGNPAPLLEKADAVLVLDALAPWMPDAHGPADDCPVIQIGQDPLKSRTPIRNFRSDISIAADVEDALVDLKRAMDGLRSLQGPHIASRRFAIADTNRKARASAIEDARGGMPGNMTKEWVSLCVSDAVRGRNAMVLSELGCPMAPMHLDHHQAWYQEPHSGGLGWSFPAGLGMQLADRDRLVVATMGDGSYIFSNPVACHQIAEALELPMLLVILNNAEWGAVRQSVLGIYPHGYAAKTNQMPLIGLSPSPDFTKIAHASNAWAKTVTNGEELPKMLQKALQHIQENRSLALLDVKVRA